MPADELKLTVTVSKAKTNKANDSFALMVDIKGMDDVDPEDVSLPESLLLHVIGSVYAAVSEFHDTLKADIGEDAVKVTQKHGDAGFKLAKQLGLDDDAELDKDMQELSDTFDASPDVEEDGKDAI